jgi:hypothetical protein
MQGIPIDTGTFFHSDYYRRHRDFTGSCMVVMLVGCLFPRFTTGRELGDLARTPLATATDKHILEWYGLASESYLAAEYSGFIDMNRSDYATKTLYSPDTWFADIRATQTDKWGSFAWSDLGLVFAGSFDEGTPTVHPITMSQNDRIVLTGTAPATIYEKYHLVDSAYAVARGADIAQNATCITDLNLPAGALDNALLLFYDYRPWNGESFCADNANQNGNVAVLATSVNAFRASVVNGTIRLSIDTNRTVRGGNPVRLSKQKVVF